MLLLHLRLNRVRAKLRDHYRGESSEHIEGDLAAPGMGATGRHGTAQTDLRSCNSCTVEVLVVLIISFQHEGPPGWRRGPCRHWCGKRPRSRSCLPLQFTGLWKPASSDELPRIGRRSSSTSNSSSFGWPWRDASRLSDWSQAAGW
jgi:hypothetical protein